MLRSDQFRSSHAGYCFLSREQDWRQCVKRLCDKDTKRRLAVYCGDADLDFRDLSVEVPRHGVLLGSFMQSIH